jgi:serine/threonine protein kinase
LLDYFENEESIYVVTDFYEGGDLYDYMLQRKFAVGEERIKEISFQIANAI